MVTGATGGIGAATVREYARKGARLVLLARSAGLLEGLRQEVAGLGAEALVTVADVADAAAVDAAFATATRRFGRIDVVVHTAAVVAYGRHDEVPADVWERIIQVNVVGTANVARSALAAFKAADGGQLRARRLGARPGDGAVHGLVRHVQVGDARSRQGAAAGGARAAGRPRGDGQPGQHRDARSTRWPPTTPGGSAGRRRPS